MYKPVIFLIFVIGLCAAAPRLDLRIVGGQNATDGAYPYMASIRLLSNQHFCGAAILTKRTILTASHCIDFTTAPEIMVVVGTNYLSTGGTEYLVQELKVHPDYNETLISNDIGLIIVNRDIEFNERVQPIQYATETIAVGTEAVITGWGLLNAGGSLSESLQELTTTTISFEDCKNLYTGILEIYESTLCVMTPIGQGACSSDSGGPVVADDTVVGVVSFGIPCGRGYPDGLARVSYYKDWLEANIE